MEICHLTKIYNGLTVLDDFNLSIPDHGIICLFGPSGSGKTTLLRMMAGLEKADKGRIRGLENRRIGMVFQEDRLLRQKNALDNVSFVNPRKNIKDVLRALGLEEAWHKPVSDLSGGMKRRVALARALAYTDDVLLMDEPFKGLDEKIKKQVMDQFKDLGNKGLVIFVTHDRAEAEYLADQVIFLEGPPLYKIREEK